MNTLRRFPADELLFGRGVGAGTDNFPFVTGNVRRKYIIKPTLGRFYRERARYGVVFYQTRRRYVSRRVRVRTAALLTVVVITIIILLRTGELRIGGDRWFRIRSNPRGIVAINYFVRHHYIVIYHYYYYYSSFLLLPGVR